MCWKRPQSLVKRPAGRPVPPIRSRLTHHLSSKVGVPAGHHFGIRCQKSKGPKLNDNGTVNQMDTRVSQLELKVLYDISQIIGQALNLDQTLEIILEILSEYLSMKRATITLKNGEEDTLSIRASHGLRPKEKRKRGISS